VNDVIVLVMSVSDVKSFSSLRVMLVVNEPFVLYREQVLGENMPVHDDGT
jgi:hypothetical protein